MIVKLIAPGIIPGDVVTVNHMAGVPQRGDRVLVETRKDGGEYDEELLTVKSVTWPVEVRRDIAHHAIASPPEVLLDRAEDVGDGEPSCCCSFLAADECCGPCSTDRHKSCVGPLSPLPTH
ncbi:hypothetical protein [Mycobacterium sp. PSTR-4-N]|uniref:hypothetical protein n=1 Tax=Mycobacterium sp. PSTR-4-N TaxID=2917745 RepID=UPI001F14FDBA|nr:hypothetical protein [Mycobacterium sp. PSTR-4-N]MCG7596318.1 hypothetical protein [Mycobacterium sp. PSTR-4-N]